MLWAHRRLLLRATRSELSGRHAGSLLGLGWVVLAPLFIMAIYAAVYLYIFRIQVLGFSEFEYLLFVVSGLVPFLVTAEALSYGVGSVVANKAVLANVVFPIDLVPAKAVLSAQPVLAVGAVFLIGGSVIADRLTWWVLLLPVIWTLHALALVGVVWVLSLVNIIFRDLTSFIGVVVMMLLVASPIAYTPAMVPGEMRFFLIVNPFAHYLVWYQKVFVLGEPPTLLQVVGVVTITGFLFGVGGWFFARAKRVLVDYV